MPQVFTAHPGDQGADAAEGPARQAILPAGQVGRFAYLADILFVVGPVALMAALPLAALCS